ncbi:unnamed protein product, partial [Mesorhabditis belari]|uniref:Uncharacterized protein n=1 Tax=Mesorhabditis belari TaxID=2138241 RepID=A0AAF3EGD9_9BILA
MHSIIINESISSIDRCGREGSTRTQTSSSAKSQNSSKNEHVDDVEMGTIEKLNGMGYDEKFEIDPPLVLQPPPRRKNGKLQKTDRPVIREEDFGDDEAPETSEGSSGNRKVHLNVEPDDGRDSGCQVDVDDEEVQHYQGRRNRMNKRPAAFSIEAHTKKYIPRGSIRVTPTTHNPTRWPSAFYFPDAESPVVVKEEDLEESARLQISRNCLIMLLLFVVSFCFLMGIMMIDMVRYHRGMFETYTNDYPKNLPNFPGYANLPTVPSDLQNA